MLKLGSEVRGSALGSPGLAALGALAVRAESALVPGCRGILPRIGLTLAGLGLVPGCPVILRLIDPLLVGSIVEAMTLRYVVAYPRLPRYLGSVLARQQDCPITEIKFDAGGREVCKRQRLAVDRVTVSIVTGK